MIFVVILKIPIYNSRNNTETDHFIRSPVFPPKNDFLSHNPSQSLAQQEYCQLPNLNLEGHKRVLKPQDCNQYFEWGYLKKNLWNFNKTVLKPFKSYNCKYRSITRYDDFKLQYSNYSSLVDKQLIKDDLIEVELSIINHQN